MGAHAACCDAAPSIEGEWPEIGEIERIFLNCLTGYTMLLDRYTVGSLALSNRIAMSPMTRAVLYWKWHAQRWLPSARTGSACGSRLTACSTEPADLRVSTRSARHWRKTSLPWG